MEKRLWWIWLVVAAVFAVGAGVKLAAGDLVGVAVGLGVAAVSIWVALGKRKAPHA